MSKAIHQVLFVGLLCVMISPAYCHSFKYTLHRQRVDTHHILVNVYDRVKAKAVWQHPILIEDTDHLNLYRWSKDHNAFAIAEEHSFRGMGEGFRLWIWRAGKPVQMLTKQDILHRAVTAEQADWSADNHYLLLRFSQGTGGADANTGSLWLLDVSRGTMTKISNQASQAFWLNSRSVQLTDVWVNFPDTWNGHRQKRRYLIEK